MSYQHLKSGMLAAFGLIFSILVAFPEIIGIEGERIGRYQIMALGTSIRRANWEGLRKYCRHQPEKQAAYQPGYKVHQQPHT